MRPAVFFDRDNTLVATDGYLGDPASVRLVEGAAEAVARARAAGFAVVVVSNQSGVARGLYTERDVHAVDARMAELLQAGTAGARVDRHEFCPHHPEARVERYRMECACRKPRPGMLLRAAEALGLDLGCSFLVGDAPRDVEAGRAAGCRCVLLRDPRLGASPAAAEAGPVEPDFVARSLQQAMDWIEAQARP